MKKFLFLFFVVCVHTVFAQQYSDGEKEILMLQDGRSLGDGKLAGYLKHSDEHLRYRAAIALANIQDTTTVEALLPSLKDNSVLVRSAAAFALGQIGSAKAEEPLLSALHNETNPEAFGRIAEALGRCGTETGLLALTEHKFRPEVENARDQLVLAISRFALRQIKTDRAVWFCFDQLSSSNSRVRWSALFALWRMGQLRVIDIEIAKRVAELKKLIDDPSPDVRMNLATLLSRAKVSEAADLTLQLSDAEAKRNEWRTQVNTVRALAALAPTEKRLLPALGGYVSSPNDNVSIATSQALLTLQPALITEYADRAKLESDLVALSNNPQRADLVRGEALVALGRFFPEKVNVELLTQRGVSIRLKTKVLEAISSKPSLENFSIMLKYLEDDSVRVAMAAWDFFRRTTRPASLQEYIQQDPSLKTIHGILFAKIHSTLNRRDMALSNLVANAVGDTAFFGLFSGTEFQDKIRAELVQAYGKLSSPDDTETMQAVLEAIGNIGTADHVPILEKALKDPDRTVGVVAAAALRKITGKDYSQQVAQSSKPEYTDYDWHTLEKISSSSKAIVTTEKGKVVFQLYREHAPFTVLNFVKLARKGFYKGLNFHRVVPNFVIQGGDPRGDGWGGPGYAIRSEFSLVNYVQGMAGIASAGKDTEGCQFFVVHSPQPHLDGRYSIFAGVTQGIDVVDKIQVGDKILKVEIVE